MVNAHDINVQLTAAAAAQQLRVILGSSLRWADAETAPPPFQAALQVRFDQARAWYRSTGPSSLPEGVLLKQVRTDVASIQISDFTARPDVLQAEDPCPGDVGVLFGLDHDDEAGVYWD